MATACGVSNARMSVCSPRVSATHRVPEGPPRPSNAFSTGFSADSEETSTVAIAAMSKPSRGTDDPVGGVFRICFLMARETAYRVSSISSRMPWSGIPTQAGRLFSS